MPSKQQNREYLRDEVIPHVREMARLQEIRMLREVGTCYTDPGQLIDDLNRPQNEQWEAKKPAVLNFGLYNHVYAANCNIINDKYDCGRTGCLAGWYMMMSEQQRRFQPWDPQWTSILSFSTHDLARHFNISFTEAHDIFGSTGEGAEREMLEGSEYDYDDNGHEYCIEEIAVQELTQSEMLEIRVDVLEGVMA